MEEDLAKEASHLEDLEASHLQGLEASHLQGLEASHLQDLEASAEDLPRLVHSLKDGPVEDKAAEDKAVVDRAVEDKVEDIAVDIREALLPVLSRPLVVVFLVGWPPADTAPRVVLLRPPKPVRSSWRMRMRLRIRLRLRIRTRPIKSETSNRALSTVTRRSCMSVTGSRRHIRCDMRK